MEEFKLPKVVGTSNKCIRFPNDIIDDVNDLIEGTGCTFTAFVVEATRVATVNLKEKREQGGDK